MGEHDSDVVNDEFDIGLDEITVIGPEPVIDRRRPSLAVSANMLSGACTTESWESMQAAVM